MPRNYSADPYSSQFIGGSPQSNGYNGSWTPASSRNANVESSRKRFGGSSGVRTFGEAADDWRQVLTGYMRPSGNAVGRAGRGGMQYGEPPIEPRELPVPYTGPVDYGIPGGPTRMPPQYPTEPGPPQWGGSGGPPQYVPPPQYPIEPGPPQMRAPVNMPPPQYVPPPGPPQFAPPTDLQPPRYDNPPGPPQQLPAMPYTAPLDNGRLRVSPAEIPMRVQRVADMFFNGNARNAQNYLTARGMI